jgi:hypothetical protein
MGKQALCILAAILICSSQASAKGGNYHTDDRYNPQHINDLPPRVREKVLHVCSTPRAMHTFATYSDNMRQLVLHYEHFYCEPQRAYCKSSGQCLHQVYVSAGGPYKLIRSYYAPPGD